MTEPIGGAHRDPPPTIAATGEAIADAFDELKGLDREAVRRQRREKFLASGAYDHVTPVTRTLSIFRASDCAPGTWLC